MARSCRCWTLMGICSLWNPSLTLWRLVMNYSRFGFSPPWVRSTKRCWSFGARDGRRRHRLGRRTGIEFWASVRHSCLHCSSLIHRWLFPPGKLCCEDFLLELHEGWTALLWRIWLIFQIPSPRTSWIFWGRSMAVLASGLLNFCLAKFWVWRNRNIHIFLPTIDRWWFSVVFTEHGHAWKHNQSFNSWPMRSPWRHRDFFLVVNVRTFGFACRATLSFASSSGWIFAASVPIWRNASTTLAVMYCSRWRLTLAYHQLCCSPGGATWTPSRGRLRFVHLWARRLPVHKDYRRVARSQWSGWSWWIGRTTSTCGCWPPQFTCLAMWTTWPQGARKLWRWCQRSFQPSVSSTFGVLVWIWTRAMFGGFQLLAGRFSITWALRSNKTPWNLVEIFVLVVHDAIGWWNHGCFPWTRSGLVWSAVGLHFIRRS